MQVRPPFLQLLRVSVRFPYQYRHKRNDEECGVEVGYEVGFAVGIVGKDSLCLPISQRSPAILSPLHSH